MKYRVVYICETHYEIEVEADSFEDAWIEADATPISEFNEVVDPLNGLWDLEFIEDEKGRREEYF